MPTPLNNYTFRPSNATPQQGVHAQHHDEIAGSLAATYPVLNFGAVGDGVTNDTAAINAAIVAANAAGGGIVYLPVGTYMVTTIVPLSNVSIRGAGPLTVLKQIAATNAAVINNAGGSKTNVEIADLTVDGNKANQTLVASLGIVFVIFTKSAIRRVVVQNTYGNGIQLFQGSDLVVEGNSLLSIGQGTSTDQTRVAILAQTADRVRVVGNTLNTCGDAGILLNNGCTNSEVALNTVQGTNYMGIGLGTGNTNNISITGNVVKNCTLSHGIDVGDAVRVSVVGNTIDGALGGISCDASLLSPRLALDNVFANNKISNTTGAFGICVYGPQTNTGHGVTVTGNVFSNIAQHAIAISAIREATIVGNVCRNFASVNAGYAGIKLDVGSGPGGCQGFLVVGNRFYDSPNGIGIDRGTGGSGATNNNNNTYIGNRMSGCQFLWGGTAGPGDQVVSPGTFALTYSATIATDVPYGPVFTLAVTNGTAFTISTPINPMTGTEIIYDIKNSSGGAHGVITWGAGFLNGGAGTVGTGAFAGIANGKRRTIRFYYDGTNWIEQSRTADQ